MTTAILNLDDGELVPVASLVKSLSGRRPSPPTVWRWCLKGVKSADGGRVRLQAVKLFGSWHTTREALSQFLTAQSPAALSCDSDADRPAPRSERTREKLAAAGLL